MEVVKVDYANEQYHINLFDTYQLAVTKITSRFIHGLFIDEVNFYGRNKTYVITHDLYPHLMNGHYRDLNYKIQESTFFLPTRNFPI